MTYKKVEMNRDEMILFAYLNQKMIKGDKKQKVKK